MLKEYHITPVPKPRMTQRDRWKKRPCVVRYHAFKDECRHVGIELSESGDRVIFILPMPRSWSEKKKRAFDGKPHQQTPDVDNLLKSLLDAIYSNDCGVWGIMVKKVWGRTGKILIKMTSSDKERNGGI